MSLKDWIRKKTALIGLAMANVEKNALSQKGDALDSNITQERRNTQGQLMDSLINGVVTEEVENLRWRTYKILKQVSDYSSEIVGYNEEGDPIVKTRQRDIKQPLTKIVVDKYDTYPLDLVIDNYDIVIGTDAMDNTNVDSLSSPTLNYNEDGEVISATHGTIQGVEYFATHKPEKAITITRILLPRFQIESYTKKLVVRKISGTEKLLEFYVSRYPDEFNRTTRLFISEIKKAITNPRNCDMLDIKTVQFVTYKAVGVKDFLEYEYTITSFDKIIEFEGDYVIKFKATISIDGKDALEEYRKEELDKKYENKEKRKQK